MFCVDCDWSVNSLSFEAVFFKEKINPKSLLTGNEKVWKLCWAEIAGPEVGMVMLEMAPDLSRRSIIFQLQYLRVLTFACLKKIFSRKTPNWMCGCVGKATVWVVSYGRVAFYALIGMSLECWRKFANWFVSTFISNAARIIQSLSELFSAALNNFMSGDHHPFLSGRVIKMFAL